MKEFHHRRQIISEPVAILNQYLSLRQRLLIQQTAQFAPTNFFKRAQMTSTFTERDMIGFIVEQFVGYVFDQCSEAKFENCLLA